MKFRFLGTAAAEAWPALFCNCPQCVKARENGGRDIRTRSQSMMDEHILIDFPCDTYQHALNNRLDLSAVDLLLITHSHSDHLYPCDLALRHAPYGHDPHTPILHIASGADALKRIEDVCKLFGETMKTLEMHTLKALEMFEYDGTKVLPIPAFHCPGEDAFCYAIESKGKRVLYLHDTGEAIWKQLEQLAGEKPFDLISYDCCYCTKETTEEYGHMGLPANVRLKARLEGWGLADAHTIHVVNHFSHNTPAMYEDMVAAAAPYGMLCSYDGMPVEF